MLFLFQETHIMHKFEKDFYGSKLKIALVGYLRGEKNFNSLDALIEAINQDIENAKQNLKSVSSLNLKSHKFLSNEDA